METIKTLMANISDDETFGRVVRALLTTRHAAPPAAAAHSSADAATATELSITPEVMHRNRGQVFDGTYAREIAAAVRSAGGRVRWSAQHIKQHVPGYRGDDARGIGNALAQWARGWRKKNTVYYGMKVTDVEQTLVAGWGAVAVYTIESA